MKYLATTFSVVLLLPLVSRAQGLFDMIPNIIIFLNNVMIPFLLGIAFLAFAYNIFRYLIAGGGNDESRGKGKNQMLWTLIAFVLILIFWSLINLISDAVGLGVSDAPTPDYMFCDEFCEGDEPPESDLFQGDEIVPDNQYDPIGNPDGELVS